MRRAASLIAAATFFVAAFTSQFANAWRHPGEGSGIPHTEGGGIPHAEEHHHHEEFEKDPKLSDVPKNTEANSSSTKPGNNVMGEPQTVQEEPKPVKWAPYRGRQTATEQSQNRSDY